MKTILTVIFDKNVFAIGQAGTWLKNNNFYTDDQDKRMNFMVSAKLLANKIIRNFYHKGIIYYMFFILN